MSPLMKIARLCVAALTSSCALLIFSFASSSSSTLTLFLFSLDDMVAVEADVSTAGISKRKKEEIGEVKILIGRFSALSYRGLIGICALVSSKR
jgi:hypothetical protein